MNEQIVRKLGYDQALQRITHGRCPLCNHSIGQFRNEQSEQEYLVSGLCQTCQDDIMGEGGDDE